MKATMTTTNPNGIVDKQEVEVPDLPEGVVSAPFVQQYPLTVIAHPHCCPVCKGRGQVPAGFYSGAYTANCMPEQCKSCFGKGVIWG